MHANDKLASLASRMEPVMPSGGNAVPEASTIAVPRARKERLLETLRTASGARLAGAVASPLVTFTELLEAGLSRDDRLAELAMLYREDGSVDFLSKSRFHWEVMRDPALPVATARAVLDAKPSAWEIRVLSGRKDLTSKELQLAAVRGRARARWQGKSGGEYAALRCLPAGWLELTANGVDDEIVGILRNPNCPERWCGVTSPAARLRFGSRPCWRRTDGPWPSSRRCSSRLVTSP